MSLEDNLLEIMAYRGPIEKGEALNIKFSLEEAGANKKVIEKKEPVIIDDVKSDTDLAREVQDTAGKELNDTYDYLRCWMGVPLIHKDRVLGMLTLDRKEPHCYTYRDAELAMSFASQVAVAIENARLYQLEKDRLKKSERRRLVAEGLRETLSTINSSQSLDEVLELTLEQIYKLLEADSGAVFCFHCGVGQKDHVVAQVNAINVPELLEGKEDIPISASELSDKLWNREPLIIEDLTEIEVDEYYDTPLMQKLAGAIKNNYGASFSVPLIVNDELYGIIVLYYENSRQFTQEDVNIATSFASQASLAIENARLSKKVEESAIIEERNRMARELHDSVTQSLYSVTLFAEAAKRMADRGQIEPVLDHLENVEKMSQQALKEMRLLIYQLKGNEGEGNKFESKIKKRIETVERRSGVDATLNVQGESNLPDPVLNEMFLITQEALNNAQKHAEASRVEIELSYGDENILEIRDNGIGFDLENAGDSGGMGLGNMQERASKIGGDLSIETAPGEGTNITLTI